MANGWKLVVMLLVYVEVIRFAFWCARVVDEYFTSDYTKDLQRHTDKAIEGKD